MKIPDEVIEKIKKLRQEQHNVDVHINDDDSDQVKRAKDMEFGKYLGIDAVCKLLGIEEENDER